MPRPEPVRVGVLLPSREAELTGSGDATALVRFARDCERLDFDSVWAGDSLLARPRAEPLTLLAAVATATTSVTVGTAALHALVRNPLPAAHAIATLDRLAGGRLVCALGSGFPSPDTRRELAAAGMPATGRVARLEETVQLWRAAWAATGDEPLPFAGDHFRVDDLRGLTAPTHPAGPPLWCAGGADRALRSTARHFDGWLPYPPGPEAYRTGLTRVRAYATEAGRAPASVTPALYVTVLPGPAALAGELDRYFRAYYGIGREAIETMQAVVSGPPAACARALTEYVEAGARHLVVRIGSLEPARFLPVLGAEVVPAVRLEAA